MRPISAIGYFVNCGSKMKTFGTAEPCTGVYWVAASARYLPLALASQSLLDRKSSARRSHPIATDRKRSHQALVDRSSIAHGSLTDRTKRSRIATRSVADRYLIASDHNSIAFARMCLAVGR